MHLRLIIFMDKEDTIWLFVRKHKVSIKNELVVHIKHNKKCKNPCPDVEPILEYLQDEMFISEGFMMTDDE